MTTGTEPIRVLRLIARLNIGGPSLHVAYLSEGLDARGYETTLAAGTISEGEASMSFVAERRGVSIVWVPELRREITPRADVVAVRRLVDIIRRVRPHVLHTHTAKAGAVGRVAATLAGHARPPVIVHTFHGHVLKNEFDPARERLFRLIERRLARETDALITVGPQVRDELVELGTAPATRFAVVRLGIELGERVGDADGGPALRRSLGIPARRFVVGWVGRMTAVKHARDALEAMRALRDRGVEATLAMVGDGPEREALEAHASRLGIADVTVFAGFQEDVGPWYSLFDALLLPSRTEGTPVSAIESLAAKRPVVATRVGSVADVVADGVDGFLVEFGDTAGAAERLARLAGDAKLRREMGEAGHAKVIPRYRVSRLVDDMDCLYRSLLEAKGIAVSAEREGAVAIARS